MQQLLFELRRLAVCGLLLSAANMLTGCALLNINQGIDDYSGYAERVFRHQNSVIDRIMLANEAMDDSSYQALSRAELNMYDQCRLLNDYAIRERDGLEHDFFIDQEILGSINGCDQAVKAVEKLLP